MNLSLWPVRGGFAAVNRPQKGNFGQAGCPHPEGTQRLPKPHHCVTPVNSNLSPSRNLLISVAPPCACYPSCPPQEGSARIWTHRQRPVARFIITFASPQVLLFS